MAVTGPNGNRICMLHILNWQTCINICSSNNNNNNNNNNKSCPTEKSFLPSCFEIRRGEFLKIQQRNRNHMEKTFPTYNIYMFILYINIA